MKRLFLTLSLVIVTLVGSAVPAKKGLWRTVTVSDGTTVKARLVGDEFGHYWQTVDGQRLTSANGTMQQQTASARQFAEQKRAQAQQRRFDRLYTDLDRELRYFVELNFRALVEYLLYKSVRKLKSRYL